MAEKLSSMVSKWYRLARPHKGRFFGQLSTAVFSEVFHILEPIFAAQVIVALTVGDWRSAYIWLAIAFLGILLRNISWDINFRSYTRFVGYSYTNIQKQVFNKVVNAKEKNFKNTSREKLINIVGADIFTASALGDIFATKTARLIRIFVTIIIVFINSYLVGLLIIAVAIINFFILNWINTKIARENKNLAEANEGIFEKLTEVVSGRNYIKDYYMDPNLEAEYKARGDRLLKARHRHTVWTSARGQWHFVFWQFVLMLVSMYLVYLVAGDAISLAIYLILVPYFVTSIDRTNDFFNLTIDIKHANVAVDRVNTILNFEDNKSPEFGGLNTIVNSGELAFSNVSLKSTKEVDGTSGKLHDVSFKIKKGTVALFLGKSGCGKRAIFYLLRRVVLPTKGRITLDNIDIYDFDRSIYKSRVNYTSSKPFFFEGTILKNFQNIEGDVQEIFKMNKLLGIHNFITKLPQGYNTNLNKNLEKISEAKRFLIGLSVAFLAGSGAVMIYEFPGSLDAKDYNHIRNAFDKISKTRSIIIFSAEPQLIELCNEVYHVDEGRVKKG
ncbi:MAG: ABC transporter ATP-binding protein/permease [Firmicutes bacterium]|nr:ABC transporter ATP-binding protein/permease [Bacillota bacterium]